MVQLLWEIIWQFVTKLNTSCLSPFSVAENNTTYWMSFKDRGLLRLRVKTGGWHLLISCLLAESQGGTGVER